MIVFLLNIKSENMKLSKSLLQAMAVGITLGVATTSCSKSEEYIIEEDHICKTECEVECIVGENKGEGAGWSCGPCGMG